MSGPEIATVVIVSAVTLSLIVYDIAIAMNDTPNSEDTISGVMRRAGTTIALVPFAWGVLLGHFWAPGPSMLSGEMTILILGCVAGALTGAHLLASRLFNVPVWVGVLYGMLGAAAGAFLWGF